MYLCLLILKMSLDNIHLITQSNLGCYLISSSVSKCFNYTNSKTLKANSKLLSLYSSNKDISLNYRVIIHRIERFSDDFFEEFSIFGSYFIIFVPECLKFVLHIFDQIDNSLRQSVIANYFLVLNVPDEAEKI